MAQSECQVWDQKASEQLLPSSHKTAEQLIKGLPRQFTLIPLIIYLLIFITHHCQFITHHCQTLPKTLQRAGLSNRPGPGILEGY